MRKLKDVTIQFVSYVKKGANKKKFFLTKEDGNNSNFEFQVNRFLFEKNDPQRLVYGVVYEPGQEDSQGDIMDSEEIEKMAHNFLKDYRMIDKQHNYIPGAGEVVESYIVQDNFQKNGESIKKGSWILVTKASEEVWEEVQKGNFTGYSMAGWAKSIEELEEKDALLTKIAKKLGVSKNTKGKLRKDFNTELENDQNNNIWHYFRILENAIGDILWGEFSQDVKKSKVLESIDQFKAQVNDMTFTVQKSQKDRGDISMKQEFLKILKEDKNFKNTILEILKEDNSSEIKKTDGNLSKDDSLSDSAKDKLESFQKKFDKIQKDIEKLNKTFMLPGSRSFEKEEDNDEVEIGIRAKTL